MNHINHIEQFINLCEKGTLEQVQEHYYINQYMKYNLSYTTYITCMEKATNNTNNADLRVSQWLSFCLSGDKQNNK